MARRTSFGAPPVWTSHVTVDSADAAAAKVKELVGVLLSEPALGGSLILPPMDVTDTGRISIVADPQGASFSLFAGAFDD